MEHSELYDPRQTEVMSTQGDGQCRECSSFQDHVKSGLCRNHVLSCLSEDQYNEKQTRVEQGIQLCTRHENQTLRYYCLKHSKIACGDCIVDEHNGCKLKYIIDAADEVKKSDDFKYFMEKIRQLEMECKELESQLVENQTKNRSIANDALKQIQDFRRELNDYFDKAEEALTDEARQTSKENEDRMAKAEEISKDIQLYIEDVNRMYDNEFYTGENLVFHYLKCKLRVSETEKSVAEMKKRNHVETFSFHPDQQLVDWMRSGVKFGTLKIEDSFKDEEPAFLQYNVSDPGARRFDVISNPEARRFDDISDPGARRFDVILDPRSRRFGIFSHSRARRFDVIADPEARRFDIFSDPRARRFGIISAPGSRRFDVISDPGFDVGQRVKSVFSDRTGTVMSVSRDGFIDLHWDDGTISSVRAGHDGMCFVEPL